MKIALLVLLVTVAAAYSSVVPVKGEKRLADVTFLTRQKQILDLYVGIGHSDYVHNECGDYDIKAHSDQYSDPMVIERFWNLYKQGYLPVDGVFTMDCKYTRKQTIYLFDVFFFAKDFDTFYKAACWAKAHIHPLQFAYAYTLALMHREDCYYFNLPPMYEIFPTYFVPQDTMYKIFDAKMKGVKEGIYYYNNTGYEYNYHSKIFGGPFSYDAHTPHLDYKLSYFTEDIGNNAYYAQWHLRFPAWMCPEKYQKSYWFKRGEGFYYTHQQLYARYSLERMANGLPYVEPLYWNQPIKTGYTPRISHSNGQSFFTRPDNLEPKYFNQFLVHKAKTIENRLWEAMDEGAFWHNETMHKITNEEGIDQLGKVIYGAYVKPEKNYFGSYHYTSLEALAYAVKTSNEHLFIGGALSNPMTTLRDPVFYSYLNRLVKLFQTHKKYFHPYTQKELGFPGVSVKDIEMDKLVTYFERYEYDVSNAVPIKDFKDYFNHKYYASQYRMSHKPFTYKITVNSDNAYEGMVRVFIGPKYDAEEHLLTLEQKRMLMVEFDRFPVKMTSGPNVFERNYKESPVYMGDYEGLKQLYTKVETALKTQEPYYINEKLTCGVPERMQLPRGWKSGQPFSVYVVVSPFEKKYTGEDKQFYTTCGSSKLYDYRPLGYPFDKPIYENEWNLPNIYHEDMIVYHKGEFDLSPPYEYKH